MQCMRMQSKFPKYLAQHTWATSIPCMQIQGNDLLVCCVARGKQLIYCAAVSMGVQIQKEEQIVYLLMHVV